MELAINIEDYISESERSEIARDIFTDAIKKDAERILNNAAYRVVWDSFGDVAGEGLRETLKENVIKIINDMSAYNVFQRKDHWEKGDSQGQIMLDELVRENRGILDERVKQIMARIETSDIRERMAELISETTLDALTPEGES